MKELIEYFSESGNAVSFFLALVILVAIVKLLEKSFSWVSGKLLKYYNFKRGKETEKETIETQGKKITELDEKLVQHIKDADKMMDQRMHEVDSKLDTIGEKVDGIAQTFVKYEERQKSVNTILLRDKINYIYKDCIAKGYILEKQKQDFKYAYDEYIANGGNSYIINEVEPFIHNCRMFLSDVDAKAAGYEK